MVTFIRYVVTVVPVPRSFLHGKLNDERYQDVHHGHVRLLTVTTTPNRIDNDKYLERNLIYAQSNRVN